MFSCCRCAPKSASTSAAASETAKDLCAGMAESQGGRCSALSPCGRGHPWRFNKHGWVRGCGLTPHPIRCVEAPSCPLPQGERAQQRAPEMGLDHQPHVTALEVL